MNAYPRYRSSTPKKTVSDLGFDNAVLVEKLKISLNFCNNVPLTSDKTDRVFKTQFKSKSLNPIAAFGDSYLIASASKTAFILLPI